MDVKVMVVIDSLVLQCTYPTSSSNQQPAAVLVQLRAPGWCRLVQQFSISSQYAKIDQHSSALLSPALQQLWQPFGSATTAIHCLRMQWYHTTGGTEQVRLA